MNKTLKEGPKMIVVETKEIIDKHEWGIHMVIICCFSIWNSNLYV